MFVFVYADDYDENRLSILQEQNLSVGVNEWAAMWPEHIFFYGEVVPA